MIAAIYGADELGVRRHIDSLKARVGTTPEELQSNVSTFEGRDARPNDILAAAMVPPFLAAARFVLVEGIISRFDAPQGRGRGARSLGPFEAFFEAIAAGLPPTTILVFTGGAPEDTRRTNPFVERVKQIPGAEVVEYPELKGQALARHIREEGAARGIRFRNGPSVRPLAEGEEWRRTTETDPIRLLADLHPKDTLSLANELDKLALYTLGREATVDDVLFVCAGQRAYTVFTLRDALMDGDFSLAMSVYSTLSQAGESDQGIIAMIANGYRSLASMVEMIERGATDDELKASSNVGRWPALFKAAKGRAQRHGTVGLRQAYEAIVDTDRRLKLGELDKDVAVETLLARLASIAPMPRSGRQRSRAS